MNKRVTRALWVLAVMGGSAVGMGSLSAFGAPKTYVGLFRDNAAFGAVRVVAASSRKSTTITLDGVTYADHGTKDVRNLSRLDLEADNYYFSPTFLRGKPEQKLTLLVENEASTVHNITIPALGVDKDIPPKAKVQVDVTFPASGVLAFSCKFHASLGMNGHLLGGDAAPRGAR